jgi:putative MATE family efflux protein
VSLNSNSLTQGSIAWALVRLAVPVIMANVLQTAYQLTDTFWVGRLSAEAVAAVSLNFPINFLFIALGGGLPIAGSVLIAQCVGRGDMRAAGRVAAQTLLMVFVVSIVLAVVGYLCAEPIMRFMGAAPDVLPDAVRFLKFALLGLVVVFGFMAYQSLMRGLGVVYTPMFIVLVTVIINFAADPFFIFGWGPIPAMGVAGAALATLCTQALATLVGLVLLARGHSGLQLRISDFRPDLPLILKIFRIGFPSSVEQATQALGLTVVTLLVASFGTVTVAAYGIGIRVLSCMMIPAMGLSLATSTLVGQNIGAGHLDRAERTNSISCAISFGTLAALGMILFFVARPLSALLMPQGGAAIDESARFIRIMSFTFGFIGIQQTLTGTLRGAGDTVAPMLMAMISLWVLRFPLAYVLSKHTPLGAQGIWWSFAISITVAAMITTAWFLRGDWKRRRLLDEVPLEDEVRTDAALEEGMPF